MLKKYRKKNSDIDIEPAPRYYLWIMNYNRDSLPVVTADVQFNLTSHLPKKKKNLRAFASAFFKNTNHKESLRMKLFNQENVIVTTGYRIQKEFRNVV